jgi:uncharacterized cupredoxin-like copper-binding protein
MTRKELSTSGLDSRRRLVAWLCQISALLAIHAFLETRVRACASTIATSSAEDRTVDVKLSEWKIEMPTKISAGSVVFRIVNVGKDSHNLRIEGQGIEKQLPHNLKAGEKAELQVDLQPGTYQVYCPVGLGIHKKRGMHLQLVVTSLAK